MIREDLLKGFVYPPLVEDIDRNVELVELLGLIAKYRKVGCSF